MTVDVPHSHGTTSLLENHHHRLPAHPLPHAHDCAYHLFVADTQVPGPQPFPPSVDQASVHADNQAHQVPLIPLTEPDQLVPLLPMFQFLWIVQLFVSVFFTRILYHPVFNTTQAFIVRLS